MHLLKLILRGINRVPFAFRLFCISMDTFEVYNTITSSRKPFFFYVSSYWWNITRCMGMKFSPLLWKRFTEHETLKFSDFTMKRPEPELNISVRLVWEKRDGVLLSEKGTIVWLLQKNFTILIRFSGHTNQNFTVKSCKRTWKHKRKAETERNW